MSSVYEANISLRKIYNDPSVKFEDVIKVLYWSFHDEDGLE